jgi:hypothetical protein
LIYRSSWHSRFIRPAAQNSSTQQFIAAIPNPGAGIGHQMANWIAGLWFARQFGLGFAHIPFSSSQWEHLLGFGDGQITVDELVRTSGYRKVSLPLFDEFNDLELARTHKIIAAYGDEKVVFVFEQDQGYRDQFGVEEEIKQSFYRSAARQNDDLLFSAAHYNIAIHVRRGDIVAGQTDGNPNLLMRWQDAGYFENVLAAVLKSISTAKPIKVYLFSQGERKEFARFEALGEICYCLDMGAQESFLHMVHADLLITSKSSFSYKPALLSKGIKVCPRNFWHGYPKRSDWILANEDGSLDDLAVTRLKRA